MARVHPLACVEASAEIHDDAEIGPFCVVGPQVAIAEGCRLLSHVHVAGRTTIGPRTVVHPYASLGGPPQSQAYRGEPTRLVIGADCIIRENVTMNIGSAAGSGLTQVGDRGFFMAGSHVGHDCRVGDNVVFANCATLGGHCEVGDFVFLGGLSAAHQFTRIGAHAMIAGVTGLRGDVIPFGLAIGAIGRLGGLNLVGLKRRGFAPETIRTVRRAYRLLFFGPGNFEQRVEAVAAQFGSDPAASKIVDFVRASATRPLCRPGEHHHD